jgi:hypothetical protein
MDFLILHSETVQALVAGQVYQHALELTLQLVVGDVLNSVLLLFGLHGSVTLNNYSLERGKKVINSNNGCNQNSNR